jgi:hypothetical protein
LFSDCIFNAAAVWRNAFLPVAWGLIKGSDRFSLLFTMNSWIGLHPFDETRNKPVGRNRFIAPAASPSGIASAASPSGAIKRLRPTPYSLARMTFFKIGKIWLSQLLPLNTP